MTRLIACLLIAGAASGARGELVAVDPRENDGVRLFRLTVTPAAEPTPAFKHRFITPRHKLKPGNAAAFYRRIHAENHVNKYKLLNEKFGEAWSDWYDTDTPLSEVPLDKLREAASMFHYEVEQGARAGADCRRCDWGFAVEDLRGPETIAFLLPEFQEMRSLTRGVALHTRLAIAERRYADALDLMRVNYRMGRDTGKVPFLVCVLIGVAQTGIANNNALDLMAAPESPNLYWALSELPDPTVPMRDALRFEMSLGPRMFPVLEDADTAVRAHEEWNRLFRKACEILPGLSSGVFTDPSALREDLQLLAKVSGVGVGLLGYAHARQRLVDWGYSADEVEEMAVGQVLAIYSARAYQTQANAVEKAFYTRFPASRGIIREADRQLGEVGPFSDHPDREILPIAGSLLPAVRACRNAEERVRRVLAALRTIEALRMHAAETGRLPAALADVTCVPVPDNPATEEPFEYQLVDGTAVLTLPRSDGIVDERRYEIRLAD